jgi:polysaccharide pyruvyl transferase WcaK-like protein
MNPSDVGTHAEFFAALETAPGQDATIRPDLQPLSWEKASSTWAAAEIAIGMRLHALILAAANGIPSVALSYDPKVAAFMKQTEQEDAVFDIRDRDVGKLALLIRKVWDERHERSRRLLDLMPALRASATRNAEIAASLLCR